jgi:hypothetical protein
LVGEGGGRETDRAFVIGGLAEEMGGAARQLEGLIEHQGQRARIHIRVKCRRGELKKRVIFS